MSKYDKLAARIAALEAHCGIPPAADRQPEAPAGTVLNFTVSGRFDTTIPQGITLDTTGLADAMREEPTCQ